jgi:hypothetical protein
MTNVDNLDNLAAAINAKTAPNVSRYAKAQAAATQSQEDAIRALQKEVELLRGAGTGGTRPDPTPPPPPDPPTNGVGYTVNPKGVATTVYVDYGTDFRTFASSTAGTAIGSGTTDQTGTIALPALTANSVYFYRVRAVSADGSSVSSTKWFLTPSATGTTRHVGSGQTYATITAALNAANAGDTIVVHSGNYGQTVVSRSFGSLVRILKNSGDTVNVASVVCNVANNVYWGPGFSFTGSDGSSHVFDIGSGSSNCYVDGCTFTRAAVDANRDNYLIRDNCDGIFLIGSTVYGGGNGVYIYSGAPSDSSQWPTRVRFLDNEVYASGWDLCHVEGVDDCVFEDVWHHDHTPWSHPAGVNDEHHDGIQVVYGNDVIVRRSRFSCVTGTVDNTQGAAIILGNTTGASATNVHLENNLMVNFWGPGYIQQGATVTMRNVTCYGNSGVRDDVNWYVVNEDVIYGHSGDTLNMRNCVMVKPYTNGGGTAPAGAYNHIENSGSQAAFKASLTNTTSGTVGFVNAGSGDYRPTLGGNLDGTGSYDGSTPLWDYTGRGYGASVSRGCYAPSDVTTPLVGDPTYTP